MRTLDPYDEQILNLLQQNGRLTNQELGQMIGLSTSQCSRRRITLEQQGYIEGYQARLSLKAYPFKVQGLVEVSLSDHNLQNVEYFHDKIRANTYILDAYKVTGEYDYQLKIGANDLNHLNQLLSELSSSCGVRQLKTSIILERLKENQIAHYQPN